MNDTKVRILEALDALLAARQREVLGFVEFLQTRIPVLEEEPSGDGDVLTGDAHFEQAGLGFRRRP